MNTRRNVALVDSDFGRRARISHRLAGLGVHVEPFEDIDEIQSRWPRSGVLLVHDRDEEIRDLARAMGDQEIWLSVVAFSENLAPTRIVRAILDGAIDYFEWPCPAEQLVHILDTAETTGKTLGNLRLREARAKSRMQRLTTREREVLNGVKDGLSNRRIGEQLAISPRTVEIHRANMLTKMGAQHTSEAIRIAIEASLVS